MQDHVYLHCFVTQSLQRYLLYRFDLFWCHLFTTKPRSICTLVSLSKEKQRNCRIVQWSTSLWSSAWKTLNNIFTILLGKRIFARLFNVELPFEVLYLDMQMCKNESNCSCAQTYIYWYLCNKFHCFRLFCKYRQGLNFTLYVHSSADDGQDVDGLPNEGVEITCFHMVMPNLKM